MRLQNIIISFFSMLCLFFSGCKSLGQEKKEFPAIPLILEKTKTTRSVLERITIDEFIKKSKKNKKGQIENIKNKYDDDYINIISTYAEPINAKPLYNHYFSKNKTIGNERVEIKNGYPIGKYEVFLIKQGEFFTLKKINFKNTNLSGELIINNLDSIILYQTTFKKGTGYWKDYYYKESKLREEGKVKKNNKEGVWKYYSLSGGIDSTKRYTLKDAVDVRFPYCLFNKKEPCY